MWLLVTGTGRCGTGYLAKLLSSAGVNCTHEQVFGLRGWDYALTQIEERRRNPHWGWEAESSWLAVPYLDRPELHPLTVVHLVRHPKAVMDSKLRLEFYTHPKYGPYWNWARERFPTLGLIKSPYDRAAAWWVLLNEACEQRADIRYRAEDNPYNLLQWLSIPWRGCAPYENTRYNHRDGYGPSDVQLEDISPAWRERLLEMAARYGYAWAG